MLEPKIKALEILDKMSFSKSKGIDYKTGKLENIPSNLYGKLCAIICVKELIEYCDNSKKIYWDEVLMELKKL